MWQWHMRVNTWVAAYFITVAVFATVYFLLPAGQFSQPLTLLDALYFSVITITTTGFGDIAAHGGAAKLLVSLEATAGLAIVGLFLASLWRDFTQRVESAQGARVRHGERVIDLATLLVHWRYIESTIAEYRELSADVANPSHHGGAIHPTSQVAAAWAPGAVATDAHEGGMRPLLERYFEVEDRLESDLKYLLANAVIVEFPDVRDLVLGVLSLLRASDARESLAGMSDLRLQAEMQEERSSGPTLPAPGCADHDQTGPVATLARHVRHTTEALDALIAAMARLLAAARQEHARNGGAVRSCVGPGSTA